MHNGDGRPDPADAPPTKSARPPQVFVDASGRRWRVVRLVTLIVAVPLLVALLYTATHLNHVPTLGGPDRTTHEVTAADVGPNPPLIGEGPMLRVLELVRQGDQVVGLDPFTHAQLDVLEPAQAKAVGDAPYAVQRFGYAPGQPPTISLTFDDGPDPTWTPQLLDILSANSVPATFFVLGGAAAEHPEIVERMVREGHAVANHTATHPDVNDVQEWRTRLEISLTDRILRATTGQRADYFRIPFGGADDASTRYSVPGILRAQKLGYAVAGEDEDPKDWEYATTPGSGAIPLPSLDGRNMTILLHDAGAGGRQKTLDYVSQLAVEAREQGYTFTTMPQAQPALAGTTGPVEVTFWDQVTLLLARAVLVFPKTLLSALFVLALVSVLGYGMFNVTLALRRRRRLDRNPLPSGIEVPVSVVLAAYNEEPVIERTLLALLASDHPVREFIVVDDGSKDATADVVRRVAAIDDRVRLISQPNAGKSAAMDNGVAAATCDVIVTMDADTLVTPTTVGNLARHFVDDADQRLGAVAGQVRIGNRTKNLLTRWQALEYLMQINVERSAQDHLGAIMITPGACAAWRKSAIIAAGGHSTDTLAEDTDLTLTLHQLGYRVTQDDEAIAYTEAPETVDDLLAQRSRWVYGTMQAVVKHRSMVLDRRQGWLGMFTLPWYVMTIVLPLVFIPFVLVWTYLTVVHQGWGLVLAAFGLFTLAQTGLAWVAVRLAGEPRDHLLMVPVYRLVSEPLRAYLLYTSVHKAVRGGRQGWNKLIRSGSVDEQVAAAAAPAPATPATTERTGA